MGLDAVRVPEAAIITSRGVDPCAVNAQFALTVHG